MSNELKKHVESLLEKASDAKDADAAMKFAQAATNAANAICALRSADTIK